MHLKSNAPEIKWIIRNAVANDFARSLDQQLLSKGTLTDGQIGAVARILARNASAAAPVALAALNGVEQVQIAFATAAENGLKRPKLRLGAFVLKMAPATGRNAGAIYVTESEEYLGKIVDGKFHAARECSDDQRAAIIELCADPVKSAIAYGQQTGVCACCGRELTDPESIARGIGPICAENFGF